MPGYQGKGRPVYIRDATLGKITWEKGVPQVNDKNEKYDLDSILEEIRRKNEENLHPQ